MSFAAAVRAIRAEVGDDGELLDLTISSQGGGNVKYRTGARAAGLTWGPGRDGMEPVKVRLVGSGKLADNVFPASELHPDAAAKLIGAVKERVGAGFEALSMTLGLNPVTRDVRWTLSGLREAVRSSSPRKATPQASSAPSPPAGRDAIVTRHDRRPGGARGPRGLPARGPWFSSVRLQQELERPRNGPPLSLHDGVWELEYRRAQVDRMEYRLEVDGESVCDPGNPRRAPGAFGDKSVVEFPG